VPLCIPAFPDIAFDDIRALLAVFGRGGGVLGRRFGTICTLKRRARGAVRDCVQSKVRRQREKMCTFHDIENLHVMETGQAHGTRGTRDGGEDEHGLTPGFELKAGK
ncbi:MAG TPA: hypothetical protein VF707_06975, partial [Ardenticatenaceae bacterium]